MADKSYFIKWDDKYLVDVPELDEAHYELFKLVNELHCLNQQEVYPEKKILRSLHNVREYVYSHFSKEEAYMLKANFPGHDEHKKLHDTIRNNFEIFYKDLKKGKLEMEKFLIFVKSWLTKHIMDEDQKYIKV
jgi:hemerythrin